jgi:hypothetical protein
VVEQVFDHRHVPPSVGVPRSLGGRLGQTRVVALQPLDERRRLESSPGPDAEQRRSLFPAVHLAQPLP